MGKVIEYDFVNRKYVGEKPLPKGKPAKVLHLAREDFVPEERVRKALTRKVNATRDRLLYFMESDNWRGCSLIKIGRKELLAWSLDQYDDIELWLGRDGRYYAVAITPFDHLGNVFGAKYYCHYREISIDNLRLDELYNALVFEGGWEDDMRFKYGDIGDDDDDDGA
ncbi:MAG: hypothetical protein LBK50_03335 [Candidatus Nomurabacteria bacterium]|jgi:hypothetical protein|nr:hypothetical protein [Candidatus Nomurabacteria bacterium]